MLFVRYVLSFLHWNDVFSTRTSLSSVTHSLTCACYRLNAFCLRFPVIHSVTPPGGGEGVLGLIFAEYVPLASQSPYPIIVYSVANYRPYLSHFWANR